MTDYVEIEDETKTSSCSFKFAYLDIVLSICERISTLVLILICPKFEAIGVFSMLATMIRLGTLVLYLLSPCEPVLKDYYFGFFVDRMISVTHIFSGWPSFWYIVIIVGFYIISTIGTACNLYSMYSINQREKAEIEKKKLLAIQALRSGADNCTELFDFVVYHSDCYKIICSTTIESHHIIFPLQGLGKTSTSVVLRLVDFC